MAPVREALEADQAAAALACLDAVGPSVIPSAARHYIRGLCCGMAGRSAEARAAFEAAAAEAPDWVDARFNLAVACQQSGDIAGALLHFQSVAAGRPDHAPARLALARCRLQAGDADGAISEAAALMARAAPTAGAPPAWVDTATGCLIQALSAAGRHGDAADVAAGLARPTPATARDGATALLAAGQAHQALALVDRALPHATAGARFDLSALAAAISNYVSGIPAEISARHRAIAYPAARPVEASARIAALPHRLDDDAGRHIRIGLLSPDLRQHSIAWFLQSWLPATDRSRCRYVAISAAPAPRHDAVSAWLRRQVDAWIDIGDIDDDAAFRRLRAARLDILVDLSGLTDGHRAALLARRPAPIQVEWLGYPAASGHPAIDWRLTDRWLDSGPRDRPGDAPAEAPPRLTLPWAHCYAPPPITLIPAVTVAGPPTLGSFNSLAKVGSGTVALWCRLLAAMPEAVLALKDRALADAAVRARLASDFAAGGVDPDRVVFWPRDRTADAHLRRYGAIDVAIDTTPYSGATTICEALWMGVPVVTTLGATPSGRLAASMLAAADRPDWIADGPRGYIERVVALLRAGRDSAARRRDRRAALLDTPLCDGARFAADFDRAMWQLWRRHCRRDNQPGDMTLDDPQPANDPGRNPPP